MAISRVTASIVRGERCAQRLRPATLLYANVEIPCTPGNHDFFSMLADSNAGHLNLDAQPVRVLRADLPASLNQPNSGAFASGQTVKVRCGETGQETTLIIARNNSWQPAVLILMLESQKA